MREHGEGYRRDKGARAGLKQGRGSTGRVKAGVRECREGYPRGEGAWQGLRQVRGSTARFNAGARGDGMVNAGAREHGES